MVFISFSQLRSLRCCCRFSCSNAKSRSTLESLKKSKPNRAELTLRDPLAGKSQYERTLARSGGGGGGGCAPVPRACTQIDISSGKPERRRRRRHWMVWHGHINSRRRDDQTPSGQTDERTNSASVRVAMAVDASGTNEERSV